MCTGSSLHWRDRPQEIPWCTEHLLSSTMRVLRGLFYLFALCKILWLAWTTTTTTATTLTTSDSTNVLEPELVQIAICLGIVVAFWVNVALQYTFLGWRISVWVQLVPCVTLAIGMVFLPYSPRWLLERKRWREAREVFFAVRRRPANSVCCSRGQPLKRRISSQASRNGGAPSAEAAREFEAMLATYRLDKSGFDTESSTGAADDSGDIATALTPQTGGGHGQPAPSASVGRSLRKSVSGRV